MKWQPVDWVKVDVPDTAGRIRLDPRHIYIFPTRYGFLYGLCLALMLLGSLNYQSNLGLLFTFLLTGTGLVTIIHTWRNLRGMLLLGIPTPPVFAGETARFCFHLTDDSGRARPAVHLSQGGNTSEPADVPAGDKCQLCMEVPTRVRGELTLHRLQVSTCFPLGLLKAWSYCDPGNRVLVYPKPSAPTPLRSTPHYEPSEKGDKGVGADDFVGSRTYRPGDSPRHLDWKVFARERGLVTRQFGGDRAERIWLDWRSLPGLETEERLNQLCRMVLDAAQDDLRYGLQLPGLTIEPGSGDAHRHQCLTALARFEGENPHEA